MKVNLNEIADVSTGYIKRETKKTAEPIYISIIQLRNLNVNGVIDYTNIKEEELGINDRYPKLFSGDVIFAAKGSKRSAGVIDRDIKGITASNHYLIIRIRQEYKGRILPEYLSFYLRQKPATDYFNLHGTGSHMPFISAAALKELPVELPDIEKQKKTVELDKLISREQELAEEVRDLKNKMYKEILARVLSGGEIRDL
jgi:restriction endonuclease S subunit